MKKIICAFLIIICLFLISGIIGGVEQGQPITNMFWCIPLLVAILVSGYVGELFY